MQTPGMSAAKVNLAELVDSSRLGPVQWGVFTLCLLTLIMDGFDVQALGYTAPAIVKEWGVPPAALGPVFAAGNFGVLIGSLLLSMVADRVGRRPVLVAATFFFSVITILTARATSVPELLIYRFIAGIGLGSIIPQATSLVGEYSPRAKRVTLIMAITVGFTAGAAFGGFVAAALIPAFGWRSVFYFGGIVPFFIARGDAVPAARVAPVHGAPREAAAAREVAEAHRPVCAGRRAARSSSCRRRKPGAASRSRTCSARDAP